MPKESTTQLSPWLLQVETAPFRGRLQRYISLAPCSVQMYVINLHWLPCCVSTRVYGPPSPTFSNMCLLFLCSSRYQSGQYQSWAGQAFCKYSDLQQNHTTTLGNHLHLPIFLLSALHPRISPASYPPGKEPSSQGTAAAKIISNYHPLGPYFMLTAGNFSPIR